MGGWLGGLERSHLIRGPQMAPTDTAIRNAKLKDKAYKAADSQGLYLHGRALSYGDAQ